MNAPAKIETSSLASAMALAFGEIEAATKTTTGQVGQQKYKYADLGSVIDAIKPPLIKHGLFFTQRPHPCEGGVSIETFLHHAGGEELSLGTLFVPANKNDAQGFGSALTYARRYALQTAFGVPTEDDDGNAASRSAPTREQHTAAHKDDPFPLGPCKNITELKATGRDYWKDVMACGDGDELTCLRATNKELEAQLQKAMPSWWKGGADKHGETFEGLGQVIERLERDFAEIDSIAGSPAARNVMAG